MNFQTILVHCARNDRLKENLDLACRLARDHQAYLIGVFPHVPVVLPAILDEAYGVDLVLTGEQNLKADEKFLEENFHSALDEHEVLGEWCVLRNEGQSVAELLAAKARTCDVAVVGQVPVYNVNGSSDLPEQVVYGSGRPVITVPVSGQFSDIGKRITLTWNGQKEAARAAFGALPMLKKAEHVDVLSVVGHDDSADSSVVDIAASLARHDVEITVSHKKATSASVAEVIIDAASTHRSDLIVMGCYGHSRFHQLIFGGVTRHMLANMPIPILFAQ